MQNRSRPKTNLNVSKTLSKNFSFRIITKAHQQTEEKANVNRKRKIKTKQKHAETTPPQHPADAKKPNFFLDNLNLYHAQAIQNTLIVAIS